MWRRLKRAIPKPYIKHKNESELSIELINGSLIQLFGADNPDGLVGEGVDLAIIDEAGLIRNLQDVESRSLRAALADKQGKMILVTTPRGFNYFYNFSARCWNFPYSRPAKVEPNNDYFFFTCSTIEGGIVTAEELKSMAETMPPKLYDQEIKAKFTTPANRVYDLFDEEANKLEDDELKAALEANEIWVGIDFNVNPMSAVVAVPVNDECHVIDSIEIHTSNTEELCQELKNRYPDKHIVSYPDPSGQQRRSSSPVGITDFVIIQSAGIEVVAPSAAPLVKDRLNGVNTMICNTTGKRRLLVHPRATHLIQSLNGHCYKEGTSIPEKGGKPDLSHMVDALGYLIWSGFNTFLAQPTGENDDVY
jgi:hypothetical protein